VQPLVAPVAPAVTSLNYIIPVSIALHCVPRQINCHAHAAVMNQPRLMQRFDKKDIATKTLLF
jgi:hypothetical protein